MVDNWRNAGFNIQPYHEPEQCPDCERPLYFMDKLHYRETRFQPAEYITIVVCDACGFMDER